MSNLLLSCATLSCLLLVTASTNSQDTVTPLDEYIDNAETIVIGKCTRVGPVNILLRANVHLEVLLVVTGEPTLKEIEIEAQYEMKVGERYLVRLPKVKGGKSSRADTRESIIRVSRYEKIEELRTLSSRIIVLRTMNLRIDELESSIRRSQYEADALKSVKKGN